jgi:cell shape-determining protein MreD
MTPRRLIAAVAAMATVLVLQGSLLSPLTVPLMVSLPAVLVATVALQAGVSAGMSLGFSLGLLADLGSEHPAGVLALCWLALGIGCGLLADSGLRMRVSVLIVALATGSAGILAVAVLDGLGYSVQGLGSAAVLILPTIVVDGVLALLVFAPVRAVLRSDGVRMPRSVPVRGTQVTPVSRVAADG